MTAWGDGPLRAALRPVRGERQEIEGPRLWIEVDSYTSTRAGLSCAGKLARHPFSPPTANEHQPPADVAVNVAGPPPTRSNKLP
ncbi:hypothetical protein GCM10027601_21330 [Nocardioides ungokensis]